ncbi:MAG TPA: T9SS type A sorting domain-containing protein [Crocinitomicaceae bacterium]|nr:T9SS type A sorting domain-containing protein [Crocinitomicaceae bacterium]
MLQKTLIVFALFQLSLSYSATYYVDPVTGSMTNPGTSVSPWSTLEQVLNTQSFNSGDIIICRDGNHGFPKVNGVNTNFVTIQAEIGQTPICTRIYFGSTSAASYWKISGFTFELINTAPFPYRLVDIFANCDHITIENCTIQSIANPSSWTRDDWRTKTCSGIWARGNNHILQNNTIRNIQIGIINDADSSLCNYNTIQNFAIDGIRGNANNSQYTENTIMDNIIVYTYAENHYDGFQAFSNDTIRNVVFNKNTIICATDTTRQFRGSMQGMGCFDGFYENWIIENNLIITDHWHGITLLGAINCKIINNTVIDNYDITPVDPLDPQSNPVYGPAWIKITAHKNGSPSSGNFIYNNICNAMQNDNGIGTVNNNLIIPTSTDYINHFVDAPSLDFHLISTSSAIDAGTNSFAPIVDVEGTLRPQGSSIDIGSYEFLVTSTTETIDHSISSFAKIKYGEIKVQIEFDIEPTEIEIFNSIGEMVKSFNSTKTISIDQNDFSKGIYYVKCTIQGENFVIKIAL